ncbi:integral membrane protein [Colletotrichum cereale]|nr:integral membrane protein [Colletotrichum cereale]
MTGEPTSWLQNLGVAIEVFCPALALVVVALRLYIRFDTKNLGSDDACICAALALTICLAVGSIICIKELYIGIHYWEIPQSANPRKGMLWVFVVGTVYNPILALTKQSVLIFLFRLSGVNDVVRNVVWVTAIFNISLSIATLIGIIFQCTPIEAFWKPSVLGKCVNGFALAIAAGTLTILSDIITVGLPFYIFLRLKMNRKKKIGLMGVFTLGIIVTPVSVIRLYFIASSFIDVTPDKSFSLGFCVSQIECSLAITTASAPTLWPLVRRWLSRETTCTTTTNQLGWIRTVSCPNLGGYCAEVDGRMAQTGPSAHSDQEAMKGTSSIRITNSVTTNDVDSRRNRLEDNRMTVPKETTRASYQNFHVTG